jgi:hypothetical protein
MGAGRQRADAAAAASLVGKPTLNAELNLSEKPPLLGSWQGTDGAGLPAMSGKGILE